MVSGKLSRPVGQNKKEPPLKAHNRKLKKGLQSSMIRKLQRTTSGTFSSVRIYGLPALMEEPELAIW